MKFRYFELLHQNDGFSPIFVGNYNFPTGWILWRHNFATPRPFFMILVCMDRGDPTYTMVPNNSILGVPDFKIIAATPPPWLAMLQKLPWLDEG